MMDTDASIYVLPEHRVEAMMLAERALAEASGLTFYQSHGPWRTPKDATPKDRAERMEKMKRSLWAASLLGCKNWVIHPILPCGGCERNKPEAERTWELNLEFWSALLPTAKQYGMTICLENLPFLDFSLAKPQDVLRLVKAIDDPNVKICLDTGHVATFERLSAADAVRERLEREGRSWLPEVLCLCDDYLAGGVIAALLAAGIRIPEDVRMVVWTNRGSGCGPAFVKPLTRLELDCIGYGAKVAECTLHYLQNGAFQANATVGPKYVRGDTF
jgi:hypothetical protein